MELSRRDLIASGALSSGIMALAGSTAITSVAAASEDTTQDEQAEVDIIVVGAGFGGLVAAATALEDGAKVTIIDASVRTGGTALLCSGILGFGGKEITLDNLIADAPMADKELLQVYVDGWPKLTEWLTNAGAPIADMGGNYKFGGEDAVAPDGNVAMADWLSQYVADLGGTIMLQTRARHLIFDKEGMISGVKAVNADGLQVELYSKKVILACGGFMGSAANKVQFIGTFGDMLINRGNPYNRGDGLEMGLEAGADLSKGLSTYYGYHLPWPSTIVSSTEDWDAHINDVNWLATQQSIMSNIQGWSANCILVNQAGKRYSDETQRDNIVAEDTTQQKFARSYILFDQTIRDEHIGVQGRVGKERVDILIESGANVIQADTVEELADTLYNSYGVSKGALIETVEIYNEACNNGSVDMLDIPKKDASYAFALTTPPFYAIPITPGISLCYGGLLIDAYSHVISTTHEIIDGLYALPGVGGGVTYWDSVGVLASICSFAWFAGHNAAQS